MKSIYDLEENEIIELDNDSAIRVLCQRVHGGWIYTYRKTNSKTGNFALSSAFVPFVQANSSAKAKDSKTIVAKPVKPDGLNFG
jgi:hypothetical protein